jgi:putative hydrolase of the HAD superfamily
MSLITTIGFDADDTLWHNEKHFKFTEAQFIEMLAEHGEASHIASRLLAAEKKNLKFYGFGIKGFVLSMIETAVEVTGGAVSANVISSILAQGREMLQHPVELLPHAREAVEALRDTHRLVLITKGDLFDQERKLALSGLGDMFHGIEIVSDKTPEVYARIFKEYGDGATRSLMVGNSLKSDILPMLAAGGIGVHVPHELTWAYENADTPGEHPRFHEIEDLGELPDLLSRLSAD